jgi:hypothetical protein
MTNIQQGDSIVNAMPSSPEAEYGLLGIILYLNRTLPEVNALITHTHFNNPRHREIYRSILAIADRGDMADPVSVSADLERHGITEINDLPTYSYLLELQHAEMEQVSLDRERKQRAVTYARLIAEKADRRRLYAAGTTVQAIALNGSKEPLTEARAVIEELEKSKAYYPTERAYPLHPIGYLKNRPKRDWAVDHILLEKGIAVFVGDGGSGKSTFVLDMDICRACGLDFIGKKTKPAFVIWVAAESIDELYDRVIAMLKCHNLEEELLTDFLILDGRMPFNHPAEVDAFIQDTREQLAEMGVSTETHSLTFTFDTYARCTPGADENNTQETKTIVDSMLKISEAFNAQVKTIHHVNAQGRIRGNTAFRDAVDTMWVVTKEGSNIKLHCDKMRGKLEPEDFQVEIKSVVLDTDNLEDTAPVIFPMDSSAEVLTPRVQMQMLDILQASGQLTNGSWAKDCEKAHQISFTTFDRHRKHLLNAGFVEIVGGKPVKGKRVYYTVTELGATLLG